MRHKAIPSGQCLTDDTLPETLLRDLRRPAGECLPVVDSTIAEPAVFVINPEGKLQVGDVSNAPIARPDLASLLAGLKFIQERTTPFTAR